MTALSSLKVGDPVKVFDINGIRMGQPPGGWDGVVAKVGRKLVTVEYGCSRKVFRLDSGRANDDFGHQSVQTVEQAAEDARRQAVLDRLGSSGIKVERGFTHSTDTLEALVAVLDQHGVGVPHE